MMLRKTDFLTYFASQFQTFVDRFGKQVTAFLAGLIWLKYLLSLFRESPWCFQCFCILFLSFNNVLFYKAHAECPVLNGSLKYYLFFSSLRVYLASVFPHLWKPSLSNPKVLQSCSIMGEMPAWCFMREFHFAPFGIVEL